MKSTKLNIDDIGIEELAKMEAIMDRLMSPDMGVFDEDSIKRIKEFTDFRTTLTKESDRGCVLMAASYIDVKLEEYLKNSLVDNKKARDSVFDNTGPLGTFSGKINMAFLLGIIPKNIFDDLHILRKIRNDFAHNPSPLTFDEPSISSRCFALNLHNLTNNESPRSIFLKNMTSILTFFNMKEDEVKRPEVYPDFDIDNITNIMNTVIKDSKESKEGKKEEQKKADREKRAREKTNQKSSMDETKIKERDKKEFKVKRTKKK